MYSKEEEIFLFSHFDKTKKVLEYGSGNSSIEIAKEVKHLVTIEHMPNWYEHLKDKLPENSDIFHILKDDGSYVSLIKPEHGLYKEWQNYIEYPLNHKPFDIIFIDGSARVGCASVCKKLGHENTLVFIHDWQGQRYSGALQYLEHIETVFTMAKFKIKS